MPQSAISGACIYDKRTPAHRMEAILAWSEYLKWICGFAHTCCRAGKDSWGRGIERIMQACGDVGIPAPELRYEQIGL